MTPPVLAFVALGGNLGDREARLAQGRAGLAALPGSRLLAVTPVEETAPLGGLDQPPYLNQMALLETTLPAADLLAALHRIEDLAGRVRSGHWASRTLDLDLVRYGDMVSDAPALRLPHPGLADRPFWQRQVAELAVAAGRWAAAGG